MTEVGDIYKNLAPLPSLQSPSPFKLILCSDNSYSYYRASHGVTMIYDGTQEVGFGICEEDWVDFLD